MEYLDVVDENDVVVGKALREDVYARALPHRIVHVLVFDGEGRIALQQRGRNQSFCPMYWGTSVGGHVQTGETYEQAARRELLEELEQEIYIQSMGKYMYQNDSHIKFLTVFRAEWNSPLIVHNDEVERVDFLSFDQVERMIRAGEKFMPEFLFLLKNLVRPLWS